MRILLAVVLVGSVGCPLDQNDPYGTVTSENYREANRAVRRGHRRRARQAPRRMPTPIFRDRDLERQILVGARAYALRRGWGERLRKVRILEQFPRGYEVAIGARFSNGRCAYHRLRVEATYEGAFVVVDEVEVRRLSCRAL